MPKLTHRIPPHFVCPFPARAFFNAISDQTFVRTIRLLRDGFGASINDVHCERPNSSSPDESPWEGARFALYEEEAHVSETELALLVRLSCDAQRTAFPEQASAISELLDGWKLTPDPAEQ